MTERAATDLPPQRGRLARGFRKLTDESAAARLIGRGAASDLRPVSQSARVLCGDSHAAVLETIVGRAFDHREIQPRT